MNNISSSNFIFGAVVLTFSISLVNVQIVVANQPTSIRCSNTVSVGKTLQQIGIQQYKTYLLTAQQSLKNMQSKGAISFPLGLTCPIRLNDDSQQTPSRNVLGFKAIGYLDVTGNIQPITPDDLIKIFGQHIQRLQQTNQSNSQTSNVYLNTVSVDNEPSDQTLPAIDLIVLNTRNNRPYFVPSVRFSTVLIDALNATLTKKVAKSSYNLKDLNIN